MSPSARKSQSRTSISVKNIPPDLLRKFDTTIEKRFQTRSEAIRHLMRKHIDDNNATRVTLKPEVPA